MIKKIYNLIEISNKKALTEHVRKCLILKLWAQLGLNQ